MRRIERGDDLSAGGVGGAGEGGERGEGDDELADHRRVPHCIILVDVDSIWSAAVITLEFIS